MQLIIDLFKKYFLKFWYVYFIFAREIQYVFLVFKLKLGGYKYNFQKNYEKFSWSKSNLKVFSY